MAKTENIFGEFGGGSINPTYDSNSASVKRGTTKTFTVDTSKRYILIVTYKYNDSTYRTDTRYINKGTIEDIHNWSEATGATISISGTTISITSSSTNYYLDITLILLD